MHGSTSPLKNGWPACSQRQRSRTCATARRTLSERGSTPKSCRLTRLYAVAVQGWPLGSSLLPDVALRRDNIWRRIGKIAQHLPADGGVGVQQPVQYGQGPSLASSCARAGAMGCLEAPSLYDATGSAQRLIRRVTGSDAT